MKGLLSHCAFALIIGFWADAALPQDVARDADSDDSASVLQRGGDSSDEGRFLASRLIGTSVRNTEGEDLGEIEDLLVSPDDRIVSAIVSVGGVLGIGDKLVAVPYRELRISTDGRIYLPTTKEQLAEAPQFVAAADSAPAIAPERAAIAPERDETPATRPDAEARAAAQAEARETFAADDPRVSGGVAQNKEAFDEDRDDAVDKDRDDEVAEETRACRDQTVNCVAR